MIEEIRTERVQVCPICGSGGSQVLYTNLTDHIFTAPGEWTLKQCHSCGTAYLDPRLTQEEIGKAYETYSTHAAASNQPNSDVLARRFYEGLRSGYLSRYWGYTRGTKRWQRLLGPLLRFFPRPQSQLDSDVMYLGASPGRSLLDVGCGSGELTARMQNLGWQVEGLDFDAIAVREARKHGFEVRLGTLEEQSYPDESFDAIIMSHVVEHVHDPFALLAECNRILKPGGRMVALTPNARSLCHRVFRIHWRGLEPPRHLQIFDPLSLQSLVTRAGFERVSIRTTVRSTSWMFVRSYLLWRKGHISESEPASLVTKLCGLAVQHLAWFILQIRPYVGEEVVMVAVKDE